MAGVVKCWTGGPGVQVDPTDNVVSLGDRYGPVIRLGSRRVLTDEQCVDLREQILSTVKAVGDGADLLVNKYQDERKFARIGLASLKGVLKEDKWQMIATDLVEPYFRGCFFFLASVSGFVVPPGADAQVTHTDHWFARYARGNKCVVVHIPLGPTSSVQGKTEWRRENHTVRASAWGHQGYPYSMNAGLLHGGSANGTSQPRVVLALRYLPAYISEDSWEDFVDHFQCSVVGHPDGPYGGVPSD